MFNLIGHTLLQHILSSPQDLMHIAQSEEDQQTSTSKPLKKKRMTYDYIPADIKRRVVEYASKHGTRPAAQLFDINVPTIRYWKQKGFDISRGRKVTYGKHLDIQLYHGLMALKSDSKAVTVDRFIEYAKKEIDEHRPDLNFKCSRGWLEKFFKRHNLVIAKSESGKVMDIVERPRDETQLFGEDDLDEPVDEEEDGENGTSLPTDGFVMSLNLTEPSDQLAEQNRSEETFSLATNNFQIMTPEQNHMVPPLGSTSEGTLPTEQEALAQQKAKTQHMMNILKKLKSNRRCIDTYQKQEVIEHAKQYGSRSAERTYGVPETTIRYWVKKNSLGNKPSPTSTPSSSGSSLAQCLSISAVNSSLMANPIDGCLAQPHSDGPATDKAVVDCNAPVCVNSNAVGQILLWALAKKSQGECVSFDELCDQALSFISITNPKSAYSSTRKWVGQFLDLKLRDVLDID